MTNFCSFFARNISSGARMFDSNIGNVMGRGEDEAELMKIKYGSLSGATDPSLLYQ